MNKRQYARQITEFANDYKKGYKTESRAAVSAGRDSQAVQRERPRPPHSVFRILSVHSVRGVCLSSARASAPTCFKTSTRPIVNGTDKTRISTDFQVSGDKL